MRHAGFGARLNTCQRRWTLPGMDAKFRPKLLFEPESVSIAGGAGRLAKYTTFPNGKLMAFVRRVK